jgi:ATP-dependent DNA helicase RecG
MLLEELQKLVAKGETENLEFKKTTGQRTEATKTICGMLNGIGGFLLFGVSDKGELIGQQVTAKTLEDISTELRRIEPPVFPEIETVAIGNDRSILIICVPGKCGTYSYDGRPYVRHGPTTIVMPQEVYERRLIEKFHAHRRWENELAPDWVKINDLDEEEIQSTLQNAIKLGRMKKPISGDTESILRGLSLFDDGRLTNAAIVLYGKSDRLFSSYPQLTIRLARFRGENRLTGFMDNRDYWGHAFSLLRRSELFLLDHVPISGRVIPGKIVREDYPLYPPLATREAVANAICHREYTTPGGAVAIALYDNRLEIINPGIFHFGMTPEKLIHPHESKPWNPLIASVFYRAGIIEKWGIGTLNIVEWCKENRNPSPTWETRTQSIIVTFYPSAFFATGKKSEELQAVLVQPRPESGPESRPESRPESGPESESEPESRHKFLENKILNVLRAGSLSKSEIMNILGYKHASGGLKKALHILLAKGTISYTIPEKPNSRLQKYKLTNP